MSQYGMGERGPTAGVPGAEKQVSDLRAELQRRQERVEILEAIVASQQQAIARMTSGSSRLVAARLRRLGQDLLAWNPLLRRAWESCSPLLKMALSKYGIDLGPAQDAQGGYEKWIARNTPTPGQLERFREEAARLPHPPLFSLVVLLDGAGEPLVRRCIDSVRRQLWARWELCVVDGRGDKPEAWSRAVACAREDERIRTAQLEREAGTAAAARRGLELAAGDFVAFLDDDGELAPEALLALAARLALEPDLEMVYSDEDLLDDAGRRVEPFFKPDWSPDLMMSMNYLHRLTVVRRPLLEEVRGSSQEWDGRQEYDLLLRLTERTRRIGHLPRVLFHGRRSAVPPRASEGRARCSESRALKEALTRRGIDGKVESPRPGIHRVRYAVRGQPLVSIVMPTRDRASILRSCVESIERSTTWPRWELILVDNGSAASDALAYLEALGRRHRVLRDDRSFNWSALNNRAALEARGEQLLFMNNDLEVIAPDWMEALLEHAQRPEVGAVGARLIYPNGRVQHAGVVLGIASTAGHAFHLLPADAPGYASLGHVVRNVSAVTGACMMVPRDVFERAGGFDERLPIAYNDVDFCLRLRKAGNLVVYTPYAMLYHHESATRQGLHPFEDEALFRVRWRRELLDDPYYSTHLTRDRGDFSIRD